MPPIPADATPLLPPPEKEIVHEKSWLRHFTRITSTGNYIPEIDGLRFIAIMMVLIYHLEVFSLKSIGRDQTAWNRSLAYGVELFFAISGFILALPFAAHFRHAAKKVRVRNYFLRRITRLEPPYILFMTVMSFAKAAANPIWFPAIFTNLGLSIFYLQNALVGEPSPISVVVWSLEIEVQFYVVMALLAFVFLIRNRWMRRALLVLPCLILIPLQPIVHPSWMFLHPEVQEYNRFHLLNYFQFFAAGILLADIWVTEWQNKPPAMKQRLIAPADIIWVLTWLVGLCAAVLGGSIEKALMPLAVFLICLTTFQSVQVRRLMRVPIIVVIGGMCYSIYLIHNPVLAAVYAGFAKIGPLSNSYYGGLIGGFVFALPTALIISATYFRFIERPCMRRDWWQRFKAKLSSLLFVEDSAPDR